MKDLSTNQRRLYQTAQIMVTIGTVAGTGIMGWMVTRDLNSKAIVGFLRPDPVIWPILAVLMTGAALLFYLGMVEDFAKKYGRAIVAVGAVGLMLAFAIKANPEGELIDKVLIWSFVVFTVGVVELFILCVVCAVLGKIDLSRAFLDKSPESEVAASDTANAGAPAGTGAEKGAPIELANGQRRSTNSKEGKPSVSLSRLQAFVWTIVILIAYFHRVVKAKAGELPTIAPELLMLMGISGAVYLASKNMEKSTAAADSKPATADSKPATADSKPAAADSKPATAGGKAGATGDKPTT